MFKKIIAIAMAATMAFSVAPVATVATTAKAESITTPTDLSRISKETCICPTHLMAMTRIWNCTELRKLRTEY